MIQFFEPLLKQRERWILWTPVAIGFGVGGYFSLHAEPPLWAGIVGLAVLGSTISPFYGNKAVLLLWLPFFLITLGFTAAQMRTWSVEAPVLERKTYPLMVEGRVAGVEALPEQAYRMVLDKLEFPLPPANAGPSLSRKAGEGWGEGMPQSIRLKLKKGTAPPAAGDTVRVRAMLLPLSPPVLPGAYDFQRHAFFDGIGATGFTIGEIETVQKRDGGFFFENLRRYLRTRIHAAIENKDAAAITTAMLYGEEKDISKETYDTIRAAGIAHLIAISGLQVTLVTGFFFFFVRSLLASIPYVALRWPVKKITAFIAMCGAVFYMMLIGDSISAERSVIMVCVVMLAIMLDRDPFTLRLAAFAATVILLFQPENLFGPGFQLSFAAVVALIAFYESTKEWWRQDYESRRWYHKVGLYILASLSTTLVATLATASFALYHFLRTPLLPGLVANLIAVPLSSFVTMPAAIAGCFLMPLGFEKIPLALAEWSIVAIIETARVIAEWPYAVYHTDAWPIWILTMMAMGGIWICLWRDKIRWLGIAPVVAGMILIPLSPRADVLIAEGGKIFAVRDDSGILHISSGTSEKFVSQSWIEREAEPGYEFWPEGSAVACDGEACLYRRKGHTISFIRSYTALERDCAEAAIVISNMPIKRHLCPQPKLLLDKWTLTDKGAHALYFEGGGSVRVRTVYDERGRRPWVPRSKFYEKYEKD